jgi:diguanylate cyclase (GGDEF)-like protein
MHLDGLTLLVAGWFVAMLAAIVLAGAWTQMRGVHALLWWAGGHAANSVGAAAFAIGLATFNPVAATLGGGIVVVSMAAYWTGSRVFFGRSPALGIIAAALAVWALSISPVVGGGPRTSVAVAFLLTALFLTLACREFWRGRGEWLSARWPLVAVFALHAAFMAAGFVGIANGDIMPDASPSVLGWFGMVHFERLVFLVGSAIFMVVIVREQREMLSAAASLVDSLTGAATRAAFYAQAERLVRRAASDGTPVCFAVFDLDHFKAINDTHGHAIGDRVLRSFAGTAAAVLRPGDLFGRIGGEEFAAVLPGAGAEVGFVIAERVRRAFEMVPKTPGRLGVYATVSGGVAAAVGGAGGADPGNRRPRPLPRQGRGP